MTAASHTAYSLALFFALATLNLWSERRHRLARAFRAGAVKAIAGAPRSFKMSIVARCADGLRQ